MQTQITHYGAQSKFGTVESVRTEGYLNILKLKDGTEFSTSKGMNGRHKYFPHPHLEIQKLERGDQILLLHGNSNGFKYPCFIGFMLLYKEEDV